MLRSVWQLSHPDAPHLSKHLFVLFCKKNIFIIKEICEERFVISKNIQPIHPAIGKGILAQSNWYVSLASCVHNCCQSIPTSTTHIIICIEGTQLNMTEFKACTFLLYGQQGNLCALQKRSTSKGFENWPTRDRSHPHW